MRYLALLVFLCICGLMTAQTSQTPPADSSGQPKKTPSAAKRRTPPKKSTSVAVPDPTDPMTPQGYAAPDPAPSYPPTGIIGAEKPKSGLEFQWVPGYMLQAPEPGHPLNPNDVMILTGKNKQQQRSTYAQPTMYYGAGPGYYGAPGYGGYYAAPGSGSSLPILEGGPGYSYPGQGYGYRYSSNPLPILGGDAAPLDARPVMKFPVFVGGSGFAPSVSPITPFGGFGGSPLLFGPGGRPFTPWVGTGLRF